MGWGEAAAAALAKAVAALEAVAEMRAIIVQVQGSQTRFETRIENRVDALESRIRELERENARLNGLVASGYGEALKTVVLEQHNQRVARGGDGSDGHPRKLDGTPAPAMKLDGS